jgi:hemoglobin
LAACSSRWQEAETMGDALVGKLYSILGEEALARIVAAFYRRVPENPILAPMYPEQDFAGAEERLRAFLIYRLGGPDVYLLRRGHPRLRMRHAPFVIDKAARDAWVSCMGEALDEVELPDEPREALRGFLGDVATFLMNRGPSS